MKTLRSLAAALALLSACGPAAASDPEALMARIEAGVAMPRESYPLASYERAYAWDPHAPGHSKVVAIYLHLGGRPGRRWVAPDALPVVMDGGCGVVSLRYDIASGRIESIACNGYA